MTTDVPSGIADLSPVDRLKQQTGLELVRLGQLCLLHDGAERAVRAVHEHRRGSCCGLHRRHRLLRQDGERARPAPRRWLAAVLPDQLRHDRQRLRAAYRRGLRRPLRPQEVEHGRLRFRRVLLLHAAVLPEGRPVAARRVRRRDEQHPRRVLAGRLLRHPGGHLHRGGARRRVLARLGVRLSRRRPAAGDQPGHVPRPRRHRAGRGDGRAPLAAQRRAVVGVVHADPARAAEGPSRGGSHRREGRPVAAQLRAAVHHAERDA